MRVVAFLFGLLAYALGVRTLVYLVAFTGGYLVPKTIDSGPGAPMALAITVDSALCLLFALTHSLLARESIKARVFRTFPRALVRSIYVLVSSVVLSLLMWLWLPIPAPVWSVASLPLARSLQSVSALGWVVAVTSIFTLGQARLFGLSQAWAFLRRRPIPRDELRTSGIYRLIRHPMYSGFVVAIWAAPVMSVGHMVFGILMTAYILVGTRFEESELRRNHGACWEEYRRRVPGPPFLASREPN